MVSYAEDVAAMMMWRPRSELLYLSFFASSFGHVYDDVRFYICLSPYPHLYADMYIYMYTPLLPSKNTAIFVHRTLAR